MPAMKEEEARAEDDLSVQRTALPDRQAPPASAAAVSEAGVTVLAAFAGSIS
jgi:hypothetical protein